MGYNLLRTLPDVIENKYHVRQIQHISCVLKFKNHSVLYNKVEKKRYRLSVRLLCHDNSSNFHTVDDHQSDICVAA